MPRRDEIEKMLRPMPAGFVRWRSGDPVLPTHARWLMARFHLTLTDLAEEAKVSRPILSRWLKLQSSDRRHPLPYAPAISVALGRMMTMRAIEQIELNAANFDTVMYRRLLGALAQVEEARNARA